MGVACSRCEKRSVCQWKIIYENVFINRKRETVDKIYLAKEKNKEINSIIGRFKMFFLDDFKMVQYFCNECYQKIDLNKLPEEWGYVCYFVETYWRQGD